MASNPKIEGLPEGAELKPIEGLPEGAEVRPISQSMERARATHIQAAPAPEKPGFIGNLGQALGFGGRDEAMKNSGLGTFNHLSTMPKLSEAPVVGELNEARKSAQSGNLPEAGIHAIQSIPIIGPGLVKGAEAAQGEGMNAPGNSYMKDLGIAASTPGTQGAVLGSAAQVAPLALGAADMQAPGRPLVGALPSRSRAGAVLNRIERSNPNTPVAPTESMPAVQRFQQLAQRAHTGSPGFTQFEGRLQPGQAPMMVPEARDFYSGINRAITRTPWQRLTGSGMEPEMAGQGGIVKGALNRDIVNSLSAPEQEQFNAAMREYALASKLRKAAIYGGGAAAASALPQLPLGKLLGRTIKAVSTQ